MLPADLHPTILLTLSSTMYPIQSGLVVKPVVFSYSHVLLSQLFAVE